MLFRSKVDKSLTLVKNENWKPESDPVHHQFADRYSFEFGTQPLQINQRLIAAAGDDARAVTLATVVSPEVLENVMKTPDLLGRTIAGNTQGVSQININNDRVTDLEVRKALLYAFPRQQVRQISGGSVRGDFASTVGSPTQIGFEPYDLYNAAPEGDAVKAKEILEKAGKLGQTIVYAFANTDRGQQISVAVVDGLERAGFKVVKKPLESGNFIDEVGAKDNPYDLYALGWTADWPSGSTVYPPTLDGRRIADGSPNFSHFDDPEINKEMDRISLITDPIEAGREWMKLDKRIMEQIPYIPNLYSRAFQIQGPKIGGAMLDPMHGLISLNGLWVKP